MREVLTTPRNIIKWGIDKLRRNGAEAKRSVYDRFPELKQIPLDKYPQHVWIIPDGNGRWADMIGKPPLFGHEEGTKALKEIIRDLRELPIGYVTSWGFAAKNWSRPPDEVEGLMQIFHSVINDNLQEFMENNVRFRHLGRKDRIPEFLKETIEHAENLTEKNTGQVFSLAIDYGGRDQEARIAQKIGFLIKDGKIQNPEHEITEDFIKSFRDCRGEIPSADLIIRTSGELRTSDLGWVEGDSEFYSIKEFFPAVRTRHFVKALVDYSKRKRRFGKRPEQFNKNGLKYEH